MMYKLVKPFTCLFFAAAFSLNGFGQRLRIVQRNNAIDRINRPNQGRRLQLVKEGFISRQLKLNPDESKAFWPLYHKYVQDITNVRILKRLNNSSASANGTEQIDKELTYETELVNIRKHYKDEFLRVLPPEKVSQLYKSERQFNDEVLKQLSERSAPVTE